MANALLKFKQTEQEMEEKVRRKKTSNKYFYRVTNHHELFKIGKSFLDDYQKGVKSFAISSTGYSTSQQKSILGIASFFDHEEDLKIAIISDNLKEGVFKEVVAASGNEKMSLANQQLSCDLYRFHDHFDFIDLEQLVSLGAPEGQEGDTNYDEIYDNIINSYDVVFWDVPELHKIEMSSKCYFPMIMRFDSLSIVVAPGNTNSKNIQDIRTFFEDYGINLKGLLFDSNPGHKTGEKQFDDRDHNERGIDHVFKSLLEFIRRIFYHEKD